MDGVRGIRHKVGRGAVGNNIHVVLSFGIEVGEIRTRGGGGHIHPRIARGGIVLTVEDRPGVVVTVIVREGDGGAVGVNIRGLHTGLHRRGTVGNELHSEVIQVPGCAGAGVAVTQCDTQAVARGRYSSEVERAHIVTVSGHTSLVSSRTRFAAGAH